MFNILRFLGRKERAWLVEDRDLVKIKILGRFDVDGKSCVAYERTEFRGKRVMAYDEFKRRILKPVSKEKMVLEDLKS